MTDHMTVRRVHTERGSHIEPPLGERWTNHNKLLWHAAVTELDLGLPVRVQTGGTQRKVRGRWVDVPDTYSINVGSSASGPYGYMEAWTFLNGVSIAAQALRCQEDA